MWGFLSGPKSDDRILRSQEKKSPSADNLAWPVSAKGAALTTLAWGSAPGNHYQTLALKARFIPPESRLQRLFTIWSETPGATPQAAIRRALGAKQTLGTGGANADCWM